jgi:hypothetical protein
MRETKWIVQPGYAQVKGESFGLSDRSSTAFLNVTRREPKGEGLDYEATEFHYELRWNEDTKEVMLVKDDEILYSELLS